MNVFDFYRLVDIEISSLLLQHQSNQYLKNLKTPEGKKSFGFLIWFLKKYAPSIKNIESYITEGDDDASCDIIFNNKDNYGKNVYYVVQSKWCAEKNIISSNGMTKEIKSCLSDFILIATGRKGKSRVNINFNNKYEELLDHVDKNGETKFIFLSLGTEDHKASDNIKSFQDKYAPFQIIDINRLKRDYIEMEYKGAKTHNPIETPYEPKGEIEIEYYEDNKITIETPFKSYILLLKPKTLYNLFAKYGFSLFYKNIRNPLHVSNFNKKISETIKDNPVNFWYFNNGITAITDEVGTIRTGGKKVTIHGLQVINGAQTVYSIYTAYHNASPNEKNNMDLNALVTLRLLKSGGKDFDLNVTRYTNSQNPINERDFHANDEIQLTLQKDFFDYTDVWYERRRGEFRVKLKGVEIISNESFAQTYLAYTLKDAVSAKNKSKLLFISDKVSSDGLYEKVFHQKVKYDDMLASYYLFEFIESKRREMYSIIKSIEPRSDGKYSKTDQAILQNEFILHSSFHTLACLNIYLSKKMDHRSINGKVINGKKNDDLGFIESAYEIVTKKIKKFIISKQLKDQRLSLTRYFKTTDSHELLNLV